MKSSPFLPRWDPPTPFPALALLPALGGRTQYSKANICYPFSALPRIIHQSLFWAVELKHERTASCTSGGQGRRQRASLERVSLASVAREELPPRSWSEGAGSPDSPSLPDSPLTHLRARDKSSTLRASLPPPPQPGPSRSPRDVKHLPF